MNAFWQLVRQDVKRAWPTASVLIAIYVAWLLIMRSTLQPGSPVFDTVITRITPIYLGVAVWRIIQSLNIWSSPRMHLLLALPIPGVIATGAAFLALWLELVVYGWIAVGGAALLTSFDGPPLVGLHGQTVGWTDWFTIFLRLFVFIAIIAAILIAVVQFSWLLGRTFRGYHGAVSILTNIGLLWVFLRLGAAVERWLNWDVPLTLYWLAEGYNVRGLSQITINSLPLLTMLVLSAVLFWLGARLFEARIEV